MSNTDSPDIQYVQFQPKRRGKYTPQMVKKICEYVARGLPARYACAAVGITEQTFYRWKKEHPDFKDALSNADAQFMAHHLAIVNGAGDPQVSAKILKARFPEHFSDGEKAVNVRMQVEGRVDHDASPALVQTLSDYAVAIEAVMGNVIEGEIIDVPCLPAGDTPEDDIGEPVYPSEADGEASGIPPD